jgi:uncharacterized protein YqeY
MKASRLDLARKESREVEILSGFLPPLMSVSEIDHIIEKVSVESPPHQKDSRKNLGQLLQAFYGQVDKSTVDPDLVRGRAEEFLSRRLK